MKKPTLCLIFGGKSNEYEVSLSSAYNVLCALEKGKYEIVKIGITKAGRWYLFSGKNEEIKSGAWVKGRCKRVFVDFARGILAAGRRKIKPDIVLPIMHGEYGEDGRIQGIFEALGIKCAGCCAFSSHICMDKHLAKLIASECGVKVAKYAVLHKNDRGSVQKAQNFANENGYPVFVKPSCGGSSVGVSLVKNDGELTVALDSAFAVSPKILIEEKIDGVETEVGVLEKCGEFEISVAGQLTHRGEFYTYEEKYKNGKTEYIIPAEINEKTKKELEECLKKLYFAFGISGFCRFDFFVKPDGTLIFNEVNTIPGFTHDSLFPKMWQYSGYSLTKILDIALNINRTPSQH